MKESRAKCWSDDVVQVEKLQSRRKIKVLSHPTLERHSMIELGAILHTSKIVSLLSDTFSLYFPLLWLAINFFLFLFLTFLHTD